MAHAGVQRRKAQERKAAACSVCKDYNTEPCTNFDYCGNHTCKKHTDKEGLCKKCAAASSPDQAEVVTFPTKGSKKRHR